MILRICLIVLLNTLVLESFSQAKPFKFGEERRRYLIYLPKSYHQNKDKMFPLVFNFHGGGMTMTEHMFYTGMNSTADKYGFIIVYPQGIKQDWNVGFDMSYRYGTNDTGFVRALFETLKRDYRVDSTRVYATGLSRGGFFSQRLAAEMPALFAAVATISGPLPDSVIYFHQKKAPVGVMIVHGTADEIVQYNGKQGAYQAAPATYKYWKNLNGLEMAKEKRALIDKLRKDSTSVTIEEVWGNGVGVSLVSVREGGHTWPGTHPFNIGFALGFTTREINMNELLWAFFSKHKKLGN